MLYVIKLQCYNITHVTLVTQGTDVKDILTQVTLATQSMIFFS